MGEELNWRGYLLPLLQTRFGAAVASLVLGICWFAWHIPLQFVPGDANGGFPLALWGLSIVTTAFV
jgi:membrane protease YdiL (CAAX protease family)